MKYVCLILRKDCSVNDVPFVRALLNVHAEGDSSITYEERGYVMELGAEEKYACPFGVGERSVSEWSLGNVLEQVVDDSRCEYACWIV